MTEQMHGTPGRLDEVPRPSEAAAPPDYQPAGQPWPNQQWPPGPAGWGSQSWPSGPGGWPPGPYQPAVVPPAKSRLGLGLLVGFILGLATAFFGIVVLGLLSTSGSPADVGDSARADRLYELCDEGDMGACDILYWESAVGSDLEEFGATCGGRTGSWQNGDCVGAQIAPG